MLSIDPGIKGIFFCALVKDGRLLSKGLLPPAQGEWKVTTSFVVKDEKAEWGEDNVASVVPGGSGRERSFGLAPPRSVK